MTGRTVAGTTATAIDTTGAAAGTMTTGKIGKIGKISKIGKIGRTVAGTTAPGAVARPRP
jgi:hypothetical protein